MAVAVVMVLSKWVGDRWQILIGMVLELFGYSWMVAFLGAGNSEAARIYSVYLYEYFAGMQSEQYYLTCHVLLFNYKNAVGN